MLWGWFRPWLAARPRLMTPKPIRCTEAPLPPKCVSMWPRSMRPRRRHTTERIVNLRPVCFGRNPVSLFGIGARKGDTEGSSASHLDLLPMHVPAIPIANLIEWARSTSVPTLALVAQSRTERDLPGQMQVRALPSAPNPFAGGAAGRVPCQQDQCRQCPPHPASERWLKSFHSMDVLHDAMNSPLGAASAMFVGSTATAAAVEAAAAVESGRPSAAARTMVFGIGSSPIQF